MAADATSARVTAAYAEPAAASAHAARIRIGMKDGMVLCFDASRFDPWRIQPVEHNLAAHPLFELDSLRALAARLEARASIRTHSDTATAATPFNHAPQLHPNTRSAVNGLADLGNAHAWTSLLNVQSDDQYRRLVDEVLDDVRERVELRDPGMSWRGGWVFMTSPGAVTPFHMDKEHNFILQIRGTKRLWIWEPDDQEAVDEAARDLFHAEHDRRLVRWHEALRPRARVFDLQPGMGAYMPSTSPHLVENGPSPSVTASFTYYTRATRRDAALHLVHEHLRRRGFSPPPVRARASLDHLLYAGYRIARSLLRGARRIRGEFVARGDYAVGGIG